MIALRPITRSVLKRPSAPLHVVGGLEGVEGMDDTGGTTRRRRTARGGRSSSRSSSSLEAASLPTARPEVVEALRQLRLAAARQRNMPAFRVLTDAALHALASARPSTLDEMLQVRGVGAKFVERWGKDALAILDTSAA